MRRILVPLLVSALATTLTLTAAPATAESAIPGDAPSTPSTDDPAPGEPAPSEPAPAEPVPSPVVTLDAVPTTVWAGTILTVTGRVEGQGTGMLRAARPEDGTWVPWTAMTVQAAGDGTFSARVQMPRGTRTFRLELVDGETVVAVSGSARVVGDAAPSTMTLSMPRSVVDYRSAKVSVAWRTVDGRRPSGRVALVFQRRGSKKWAHHRTLAVSGGKAVTSVRPRHDGRWALRFAGSSTLRAVRSAPVSVDNRPPGAVVTMPRGAARPTMKLPAQPRSERLRADARIVPVSNAVWRSMKGRSWHAGCPVGRRDLRVVRVSYWAFDGYVRRGEIVVHARHAGATARVFEDLFRIKAPIRSLYRVDRFGYSKKLRGADDYKSMRADNTSGFNCRQVVGRPGTRSPHAYGNSIDINPWENPFRSGHGWTPNASWQDRTRPAAITYRSTNHRVVKVLRKHGFRWLGRADLHHFQR